MACVNFLGDPFQGASAVVAHVAEDLMVPVLEVGFLLVEDIKFPLQELGEVAKHEGGRRLLMLGKIAPEEVGLNGAVGIVVAEIGFKCGCVCARRCKAVRNTTEEDWKQRGAALWMGSYRQDRLTVVGCEVVLVCAGNVRGGHVAAFKLCRSIGGFVGEDVFHSSGDVVQCHLSWINLQTWVCAELLDHTVGEGVEEDSCLFACVMGGSQSCSSAARKQRASRNSARYIVGVMEMSKRRSRRR